ncbi:MAG: winged helix-turn-helix transcriptional regulator [Thermoplasmata archaeon]|nr:winged helix-turn-helix transcriptional regulator [Thermoplasmata archaeon]
MSDGPLILTEFDRDILTELYHTGRVTIAGVDPRISVSRIARRLKTSRARVAARIREWERSGLMRGYDVWPNPALFGVVGGSVDLRLADRLRKPEMFRRIALVDGVVGGLEFLGDWVSVQLVAPDPPTLDRRVRLLGGLEGVSEVGPLFPWADLQVERSLSPLEIRIIRALRRNPRASLAEIAKAVGVSTRTMTARYGALLDETLVWFLPSYDFTALASPIVSLTLQLRTAEDRSSVLAGLRQRLPWFLEFGWSGFGPVFDPKLLTVFVFAPSAAGVEAIERTARDLPGVASAEANVLVRVISFPEAFEPLLAAASDAWPNGRAPAASARRSRSPRPRTR